jgi:Holliday junction DNA helicase RuvA
MIGSIRGQITLKAPPQLLLEVGGIGYELEAPMSTFYALPAIGADVRLLTHLVIREDAHVLYGFGSSEERQLFRQLLKVSGVGPKIALAVLSAVSADAFAQCVIARDVAALTRIPGVGRKIAERLVVELRDRMVALEGAGPALAGSVAGGPEGEAFSALLALGYRAAEATRLLRAADAPGSTTEELIRRALQGAAREAGA